MQIPVMICSLLATEIGYKSTFAGAMGQQHTTVRTQVNMVKIIAAVLMTVLLIGVISVSNSCSGRFIIKSFCFTPLPAG